MTSNSGGLAAFISIMFFSQIESFVVKSHLFCQAFLVIYEWFANMCLMLKHNIDLFQNVLPLFLLTSLVPFVGANLLFDLFLGPSGSSAGRSPQGWKWAPRCWWCPVTGVCCSAGGTGTAACGSLC